MACELLKVTLYPCDNPELCFSISKGRAQHLCTSTLDSAVPVGDKIF